MPSPKEQRDKIESESKHNFEQFKILLTHNANDCILLIKEWISRRGKKEAIMLQAVAQQLSNLELNELFDKLTHPERTQWKNFIEHQLLASELVEANKHISEEVLRIKISPFPIKDLELVDLLISMHDQMAKKFIEEYPSDAAIYLNLVSADSASHLIDQFSEEKGRELIEASLAFSSEEAPEVMNKFKLRLRTFVAENKKVPFHHLLSEILTTFNPLKERLIYKIMVNQGLIHEFREAALKNFPSDLIDQLPQNYFKEMMQNYSIPKKAELLASLNTEKKDLYLKKFADVGSSVRDIIELELENINSNPATISRIENQKDQIWKDFVTYVRSCIRSNEAIKPEMSQLINDWSHTLINK